MDPLELECATEGNTHADQITSRGNAAVMYFRGQTRFFIPNRHYETIGESNVLDSVIEVFGPRPRNNEFTYDFHQFGQAIKQNSLHWESLQTALR